MKKTLLGLALLTMTSAASAVDLYIGSPTGTVFATSANGGFNPDADASLAGTQAIAGFSVITGTTPGTIGTLSIDGPGTVSFTFLGKEAGYNNFFFDVGGVPVSTIYDTGSSIGVTSTQIYAAAGALSFSFGTNASNMVSNGSAGTSSPTFAIFAGQSSGYKYILGYDDSGAGPDRDYDDMVIGVNVIGTTVTNAVPEPEIYAMLGLGLGLMGWVGRRRKLGAA